MRSILVAEWCSNVKTPFWQKRLPFRMVDVNFGLCDVRERVAFGCVLYVSGRRQLVDIVSYFRAVFPNMLYGIVNESVRKRCMYIILISLNGLVFYHVCRAT